MDEYGWRVLDSPCWLPIDISTPYFVARTQPMSYPSTHIECQLVARPTPIVPIALGSMDSKKGYPPSRRQFGSYRAPGRRLMRGERL